MRSYLYLASVLTQLVLNRCSEHTLSKRQSRQFFQQSFDNPFQQFASQVQQFSQSPQFSSQVRVNVEPLPQFTFEQRFGIGDPQPQFLENRLDNRPFPSQTFEQLQAAPDNRNGQLTAPCSTRGGVTGRCTPLVKCISFYAELQELQSQPCSLGANEKGVCCPLRNAPDGGGEPSILLL